MSLPLKEGRCFVIAEAGTAHADPRPHRRFEKAMRLVEAAAGAGADAVKFQWFWRPGLGSMFCWIAGDSLRQWRWYQSIMGYEEWAQIKEYAEACGLVFLASAFEGFTVAWLNMLNLSATKVASRAAKTFPYDTEGLPQPFLISTGMIADAGTLPKEALRLECEAVYPSTRAYVGNEMPKFYTGRTGFSDHSGQPFLGIDAISRGCPILEVHFMVNTIDAGPDLPACLTVQGLTTICKARDYYADRAA